MRGIKSSVIRVLVVAVAMLLFGAVAAQAAPPVFPYTFHGEVQSTAEEEGLCSPSATVTVDGDWWLHVNATEAGLTEEEILALVFAEEEPPPGIIKSITYTEVGTFTVEESTGQTITGRYTIWFGGNSTPNTEAFTFTFSARGVDQDGNRIAATANAHVTLVDGELVAEFENIRVRGCP
jgi:hypothetical protein